MIDNKNYVEIMADADFALECQKELLHQVLGDGKKDMLTQMIATSTLINNAIGEDEYRIDLKNGPETGYRNVTRFIESWETNGNSMVRETIIRSDKSAEISFSMKEKGTSKVVLEANASILNENIIYTFERV